jgi:hypothetical protein
MDRFFFLRRSEMFALVFVDVVHGVSPSQMGITLAESFSSMVKIGVDDLFLKDVDPEIPGDPVITQHLHPCKLRLLHPNPNTNTNPNPNLS